MTDASILMLPGKSSIKNKFHRLTCFRVVSSRPAISTLSNTSLLSNWWIASDIESARMLMETCDSNLVLLLRANMAQTSTVQCANRHLPDVNFHAWTTLTVLTEDRLPTVRSYTTIRNVHVSNVLTHWCLWKNCVESGFVNAGILFSKIGSPLEQCMNNRLGQEKIQLTLVSL